MVSGSGNEAGLTRPITESTYNNAGLLAQSRLLESDGSPGGDVTQGTGPIARAYDAYGRLTSYIDGTGLETGYTYDAVGRLATVTNSAGTRTISYDGGGERGSLPTRIDVTGVGTFTARYGADGTLVQEGLPGGITATTVGDADGNPTGLIYRKTGSNGSSAEWLKSTAAYTAFDQVASYRLVTATGIDRTNRFDYDGMGRLIRATDAAAVNGAATGHTCTRDYAFDVNGNRTALIQTASAGAPASTCPASIPATDSYSYDTADRLQPGPAGSARAALRYDAFGRTRTLPAVDTLDRAGDVSIGYYVDDLVATMAQGTRTSTFGMDASARRSVRTETDATTPGVERRSISRYTGDDDNPDLVVETDNSVTRNILGFGGLAAVVTNSTTAGATVNLQLANLHGDIAATVPATATEPVDMTVTETTEYGLNRNAPAAGTVQPRYGWLGVHQRDASTIGGLTLMGVRLYAPTLGRFLSVDPVYGGNANAYVYVSDPVSMFDLDGRWGWGKKLWNKTKKFVKKAAKRSTSFVKRHWVDIGLTAMSFVPGLNIVSGGIRVYRTVRAARQLVKLAKAGVERAPGTYTHAASKLAGRMWVPVRARGSKHATALGVPMRIGRNGRTWRGPETRSTSKGPWSLSHLQGPRGTLHIPH